MTHLKKLDEGLPGKVKFEQRHALGRKQCKSPRSIFQRERKIIIKTCVWEQAKHF